MIRCIKLMIFLCIWLGARAQAPDEPFYVVGLKGKIINKKDKHVLNYGDKIYSRDTLQVQSKDYYLGLANSYGMYELNPGGGKPAGDGSSEFALSVMSSIHQVEYKNPDVRGELDNSIDLARLFHPGDTVAENRILLVDPDRLNIDKTTYPIGSNNFFCWRPSGTSTALTPIRRIKDTLLLEKRDFGADASTQTCDLYYQHDVGGIIHRERITDFAVVFLSRAEASAVIDNFLQSFPGAATADEKDLQSQLMALFTRSYQAAPRGEELIQLIKKKVKNKHK